MADSPRIDPADLGVDPETFRWTDLALCADMPLGWFFETYEQDREHAKAADAMCLVCPVLQVCAQKAQEEGATGLRGAVYWNMGSVDKVRNRHKQHATWERLVELGIVTEQQVPSN